MGRTVKIVIAEPSALIRSGLVSIIKDSGKGFSLVLIDIPEEIPRLLEATGRIDLIIINPGLIQGNPRLIHTIRTSSPSTQLIALIYAFYDEGLLSLFDGRITVTDSEEVIISVLKMALAEKSNVNSVSANARLSDREIDILRLLASGRSTKEIAGMLHISVNTVLTHRKNLSAKTGIRSVSGLAIYAVLMKYVNPGEIVT